MKLGVVGEAGYIIAPAKRGRVFWGSFSSSRQPKRGLPTAIRPHPFDPPWELCVRKTPRDYHITPPSIGISPPPPPPPPPSHLLLQPNHPKVTEVSRYLLKYPHALAAFGENSLVLTHPPPPPFANESIRSRSACSRKPSLPSPCPHRV